MTKANLKSQDSVADIREPEVTESLAAQFGLKRDEYALALKIMGRIPSYTELGIFSVMWSEHCSYKSSKVWLKILPTTAPWVIQGPGENAGVIDIGDGQAAIFKMESHNHPSYIEPYQGAATGVGGILRDVFTMGARPIANMNALRFGDPSHPKTRQLIAGVVSGIGGYGNSIGVPTVGGETNFHAAYNGNILVNAMTVGIADADKIFYARGASVGQPVVYVGSKTGRDGIHGATMSSAEFTDGDEDQRPTVQVGDPFTEKLLLEACLELMRKDAIISIQDMGAAGLTSSCVEIAAKGNIGVHLTLDHVPMRETVMVPYEIMLSESQERMLMILKPGREDVARKIFEKWDLDFAVIGVTTIEQNLKIDMYGKTWCDMPVPPLVDEAPQYSRPTKKTPAQNPIDTKKYDCKPDDLGKHLTTLMATPDLSSKRWVWEQYDSLVGGETISSPGITQTQSGFAADASLVKLENSNKTIAITTDCSPRYCFADPFEGGKQAVAESWRNITATGATPLAVTNNLNFGNPEKPEIMGQLADCVTGIGAACIALDYPVISGNVSLYNETNGQAILPTPVIGGVGVIANYSQAVGIAPKAAGLSVLLVGGAGIHLGQSLYLRHIFGKEEGPPPPVQLEDERRTGDFVRTHILNGTISSCHDISDGGLLVALAEMALASSSIGINLYDPKTQLCAGFWFGEDQGRYIVITNDGDSLIKAADKADVSILELGKTTSNASLTLEGGFDIPISEIRETHEAWLPNYMAAGNKI